MSGPVEAPDAPAGPTATPPSGPTLELTASRAADVGGLPVRRALPRRGRRTVGAWCFVDHLGPTTVADDNPVEIGPHPHIGLHTVTWLLAGRQLHRDSLGSEQPIRPGELNLMTAGHGVAHAEETLDYRGPVHGVQLWVAQPDANRHGAAAFAHHADLPRLDSGHATVTILVGSHAGLASPATVDSPLVGLDLDLRRGTSTLPVDPSYEHALVVLDGALSVDGTAIAPGTLAYLGTGRDELAVTAADPTRALLLGGTPFESPILMWWNFVARTREEVDAAYAAWRDREVTRFADVDSAAARIPAPVPPWHGRAGSS